MIWMCSDDFVGMANCSTELLSKGEFGHKAEEVVWTENKTLKGSDMH